MREAKRWRVSALPDEEGTLPPPDENPPVGRPLRKVLNSRPLDGSAPDRETKKPWEEEDDDRQSE